MRKKTGITSCRLGIAALVAAVSFPAVAGPPPQSVARQWNEQMLSAIRLDYARPTVHARNLYHVSVAMWDAWAAYTDIADGVMFTEMIVVNPFLLEGERKEAISFAAYRVLKARFASSPGAATSLPSFDALMDALGYDKDYKGTLGDDPAAVGNRVAITVLFNGFSDGANEAGKTEERLAAGASPAAGSFSGIFPEGAIARTTPDWLREIVAWIGRPARNRHPWRRVPASPRRGPS